MRPSLLNIFAALAVLALASPAHAQTQADSTESLVQHALSFVGLESYELPGKIDSIAQVSEFVAKDYPVPFLGKTLEGKTITRIVIDSVDIARRKHALTDKELDDLFQLTIDVDAESGELLFVHCKRYANKKALARELPVDEAEKQLTSEVYESFLAARPRTTFVEALKAASFVRPHEAGEIDAILVRYGLASFEGRFDAWILTTRGGMTVSEIKGPPSTRPDHMVTVVNAENGGVASFGNAPPKVARDH